ncbi:MAG: Two-component sensor kinase [Parcubacteria group bacterium GW2011_GWA2_44_12]|nr:MAG: Two-component sensor kinase [Parcubacteria group bacterium GW2011_GWA2_44_12]
MFKFLLLVVTILNFSLGLVALRNNRGIRCVNVSFGVFSLVAAWWVFNNFMTGYSSHEFWLRGAYAFGEMLVTMAFIWSTFLTKKVIFRRRLFIVSAIGIILFILSYTSFIIEKIDRVYLGGFDGKMGVLFVPYAVYVFCLNIAIVLNFFFAYRKAKGVEKVMFLYVLIGACIFVGTAVTVSFILPIFGVLGFLPIDTVSSVVFLIAVTYAIVRYRLMDIRVVITRSLIFSFLVLGTSVIFGGAVFLAGQVFGARTQVSNVLMTILASAAIVLLMDPLKRKLAAVTDRIFFKKEVNYDAVLARLSRIIAQELDMKKLTRLIIKDLTASLKINKASIFLFGKEQREIVSVSEGSKTRNQLSAVIRSFIEEKKQLCITEEMIRIEQDTQDKKEKAALSALVQDLEQSGIAAVIPIILREEVSGILVLGAKVSGDIFTMQEIRMFEVLSSQLGTALEKARLYEEVSLLSLELQKKVKLAMKELQVRNKEFEEHNQYLAILQKIGDKIAKRRF